METKKISGGKPACKKKRADYSADQTQFTDDLFRILADSLQTGVYILQDKRLQFVNRPIQKCTGYTEAEMLAMDPDDLIHPDDRLTTAESATGLLKGKQTSPYTYRLVTKQGQIRWIMESVRPIVFSGRKAALGNLTDITEQKETRESLQELDALKSSILDAVPHAIVGLHDRRIIFANSAVEDVFGWKPEELIGRRSNTFYRNEREAASIAQSCYAILEHQRTFVTEYPCRRKDGRDILCRMRCARIGAALKERRIVMTYEDITEQQRSREELAGSREQLRNLSIHLQSVREKESTRIAREIHDELGQSLTALQMDFSWLGNHLPEEHPSLQEKVQRMRRLVDTTMDSVHRISKELRPTLLDDLGLTAAMEWQIQEFQNRCGVHCEAALECREGLLEKDLSTAVFRIFQETLTNIARHAGASRVRVRLLKKENCLLLEVADNGKGITAQQINDSRSFGIIGIRERVNLWGGQVNISGDARKGTKVTVQIPLQPKGGN